MKGGALSTIQEGGWSPSTSDVLVIKRQLQSWEEEVARGHDTEDFLNLQEKVPSKSAFSTYHLLEIPPPEVSVVLKPL